MLNRSCFTPAFPHCAHSLFCISRKTRQSFLGRRNRGLTAFFIASSGVLEGLGSAIFRVTMRVTVGCCSAQAF
jgi:hypothetical protein